MSAALGSFIIGVVAGCVLGVVVAALCVAGADRPAPPMVVPENECEKLRKEHSHSHIEHVHALNNRKDAHRSVIGLETENADLRSELESMGTATCLCGHNDLKVENAKLLELCTWFAGYISQDRCKGCVYTSRCNDGLMNECWQLTLIRTLASDLGVEMDA